MAEIIVAALAALASFFGFAGHVTTVCANAPVAIHITANSGLEMSPTIRGALIGTPPAC